MLREMLVGGDQSVGQPQRERVAAAGGQFVEDRGVEIADLMGGTRQCAGQRDLFVGQIVAHKRAAIEWERQGEAPRRDGCEPRDGIDDGPAIHPQEPRRHAEVDRLDDHRRRKRREIGRGEQFGKRPAAVG